MDFIKPPNVNSYDKRKQYKITLFLYQVVLYAVKMRWIILENIISNEYKHLHGMDSIL